MAIWDDIITARDKQVYQGAGYGRKGGLGKKPAILVIDVTYAFVGDKPEPILKSIERYPNSCGEEGWRAIYKISELLSMARKKGVPIIYSASGDRRPEDRGGWANKNSRTGDRLNIEAAGPDSIVKEIEPQPNDIIIAKSKPSAFFGTPLASRLVRLGVDSLIVTGCTTSGCIRATVIDGFSYNYRMTVVEECTFDRGQSSHKVNLFDMNAKYADVVSLSEIEEYLEGLGRIVEIAR